MPQRLSDHLKGRRRETHCTPKSPVLNTSILLNPKHANISTDHRPNPLTATNFSINSSSEALISISALSSPDWNFSASPVMYSALRWERPAERRVGMSLVRTWEGEGKEGWVGKTKGELVGGGGGWGEGDVRAVNFLRMEAAAWPETWGC